MSKSYWMKDQKGDFSAIKRRRKWATFRETHLMN
jgi:hypothetical protein